MNKKRECKKLSQILLRDTKVKSQILNNMSLEARQRYTEKLKLLKMNLAEAKRRERQLTQLIRILTWEKQCSSNGVPLRDMSRKARRKLIRARRLNLIIRTTPAERKLLKILRSLGIAYKFQKWFYIKGILIIVDFYLYKRKNNMKQALVIEVDGAHHQNSNQSAYDEYRTALLETKRNICVIRFTNQAVLYQTTRVRKEIKSLVSGSSEE